MDVPNILIDGRYEYIHTYRGAQAFQLLYFLKRGIYDCMYFFRYHYMDRSPCSP